MCGAEMVRCFRNAELSIRTKLKQVETLSCVLRPPTPEGGAGVQRTKTDKWNIWEFGGEAYGKGVLHNFENGY